MDEKDLVNDLVKTSQTTADKVKIAKREFKKQIENNEEVINSFQQLDSLIDQL